MLDDIRMFMDTEVRPSEIRKLFELVEWYEEAKLSDESLHKAFNLGYCNFSAKNSKGELVGIIRASYDGMYVILWSLIVHPDYQGHGIGHKLFQNLLNEMRNRGHEWILAFVVKNRTAYYERNGLLPVTHLKIVSTYSRI